MTEENRPTWPDLAPILHGAPQPSADAWAVIAKHNTFGFGAVRRVIARSRDVLDRYAGSLDAATHEAHAWALEALYKRIVKPPPGLPLAERRDGGAEDAAAWFARVWGNLARDWCKAERRRWKREVCVDCEPTPPPVAVDPWEDKGAVERLRNLLKNPARADVSPTLVLAYLCLVQPQFVDKAMVQRAADFVAAAGSRSGTKGLARSANETWTLLNTWQQQHERTTDRTKARTHLAWILRSVDSGEPSTWRTRSPAEARTATETIGKWAIRCAESLTLPRAR